MLNKLQAVMSNPRLDPDKLAHAVWHEAMDAANDHRQSGARRMVARKTLSLLRRMEKAIEAGDARAAAMLGLQCGIVAQGGDLVEAHLFRQKIAASRRRGREKAHGTAEERAARYAEWQGRVDALRRKHPRLSQTAICKLLAKEFGYSDRCIRDHTTW